MRCDACGNAGSAEVCPSCGYRAPAKRVRPSKYVLPPGLYRYLLTEMVARRTPVLTAVGKYPMVIVWSEQDRDVTLEMEPALP